MLRVLLFVLWPISISAKDVISLDRIVVIGASVSRGFTKSEPLGGEKSAMLRFDRYLDAALKMPHGKIFNDANHLFFTSVEDEASSQLDRLSRRKPTLVIGVDFLFWFLYGHPEKIGDRLESFDRGLELLSGIDVPLVIGDIPDASAAIGHMLSKHMVPDTKTRTEANRRLTTWARARPQVSIISLSDFVKATDSNTAIEFGPLRIESGQTKSLLQADNLHPTHRGCAALALAVTAKLTDSGLNENQVVWNLDQVVTQALLKSG